MNNFFAKIKEKFTNVNKTFEKQLPHCKYSSAFNEDVENVQLCI